MADLSHLDDRYFVDTDRYNCPFCKRRHVVYAITWAHAFSWDEEKTCYVVFAKCASCDKESMHLTFDQLLTRDARGRWVFRDDIAIDEGLFYSVPTSSHVTDERIPKNLRELVSEAEGCLKSNFLTGASACVRKVIYELAVKHDAEGEHYEDRIKSLKRKLPNVDPTFFDTLLTIQELTSDKVHENSYDGWASRHLRLILATLHEILTEIYVAPKVREEKRESILKLKGEVFGQAPVGAKLEGDK